MREERTFVGQSPDDLKDEAISSAAQRLGLRITRLDERIEEVRDTNGTLSNPQADVKLKERLTIPYYYRVAEVESP